MIIYYYNKINYHNNMQKGTDLPIWQPSSFNIFNQLPFKIY